MSIFDFHVVGIFFVSCLMKCVDFAEVLSFENDRLIVEIVNFLKLDHT